ncbi:MAG: hypothetical protein ACREP2_00245 [Rhodanobacteraceae bacterium]
MSTLADVLKGIRETVVMDERVRALGARVDRMDAQAADTRERLIVLETLIGLLRERSDKPRLGLK